MKFMLPKIKNLADTAELLKRKQNARMYLLTYYQQLVNLETG